MEPPQTSAPPPTPESVPPSPQQTATVSGLAVGSVVSLVTCVPLLPIILGIAALRKISRSVGRRKGEGIAITAIVLGGVQLLLGIPMLAGLVTPIILRATKQANRATSTNNMRLLGMALFSFEEQYGTYPSWQIYEDNPGKFPNVTRGGDSANDLLGLLVAGGFTDSEEIFYAKGGSPTRKNPDNVFNSPATLLEPGECGYGYVMLQGGRAMTCTTGSGCPLLVAPLMPGSGGADPEFNPKPYDRRAVYLRVDQAVTQSRLNDAGKIVLPGDRSRSLFESGLETIWGKDVPDVRPPE